MSSPGGLSVANFAHHALALIARRDPDKIPQVPYAQRGSQYGYPSYDGLRNGGPTMWITGLLLGLYAGSTSNSPATFDPVSLGSNVLPVRLRLSILFTGSSLITRRNLHK